MPDYFVPVLGGYNGMPGLGSLAWYISDALRSFLLALMPSDWPLRSGISTMQDWQLLLLSAVVAGISIYALIQVIKHCFDGWRWLVLFVTRPFDALKDLFSRKPSVSSDDLRNVSQQVDDVRRDIEKLRNTGGLGFYQTSHAPSTALPDAIQHRLLDLIERNTITPEAAQGLAATFLGTTPEAVTRQRQKLSEQTLELRVATSGDWLASRAPSPAMMKTLQVGQLSSLLTDKSAAVRKLAVKMLSNPSDAERLAKRSRFSVSRYARNSLLSLAKTVA